MIQVRLEHGCSANVVDAYRALFTGAIGSRLNLVETLAKAAPLVFTGLAVAVAFRARFWNIGAEGQLLAGAMAAAFIGGGVIRNSGTSGRNTVRGCGSKVSTSAGAPRRSASSRARSSTA